jgi:hypothetical protein
VHADLGPPRGHARTTASAASRSRTAEPAAARLHPNHIWLELVALAHDLLAWTQHLALGDSPARIWEPERLRLRLLHIAGRIVRAGRREHPPSSSGWPWASDLLAGHHRLDALTP